MLQFKCFQRLFFNSTTLANNTRLFTLRCFTFLHFLHSLAATQDVSVFRIQPDPLQQLPCPQQMIEFRCQILVPSFAVQWTLPTGETLEFGQAENIGAVYVSSDNAYSASLTNRAEDPNSAIRLFFTSTLLVMEPVNGSNLTCVGVSGAVPVKENTSIIISGKNCCKQIPPMYNLAMRNPSCLPKAKARGQISPESHTKASKYGILRATLLI